jgi:DNA-directed RNA polymerase subunit RPC12/RpoP
MRVGEKHRTPGKSAARRSVTVPIMMTEITCPACGAEVDLWADHDATRCQACGLEIYKKQRADH